MQDWDIQLQKASEIIENREHYQRKMAKLAFEVTKEFGTEVLKDFAEDIKQTYGLSVSASTLRNYLWVYEKIGKLNLPEDLSYRTLQYIASSGKPEYWAERIKEEGLSSAEVYHLIRKDKGLKKVRIVVCKKCGAEIEMSTTTH